MMIKPHCAVHTMACRLSVMGKLLLVAMTALPLAACAQTDQGQNRSAVHAPTIRTAGDLANHCRVGPSGKPVSQTFALCPAYLQAFVHGYSLRKEAEGYEMPDICIPKDEPFTETLAKLIPALGSADNYMANQLARANADLAKYGMQPMAAAEVTSAPEGLLIALNQLYACRTTTVIHGRASEYDYGPWGAMKK
jgi:hypothetical protein